MFAKTPTPSSFPFVHHHRYKEPSDVCNNHTTPFPCRRGCDCLKCIETGERPVCDIEIGHRSTVMSLLGMLSMELGRSVQWDGDRQRCVDAAGALDAEANALLTRQYRAPWKHPEV